MSPPLRSLSPEVLRAMLRPRDGRIDRRVLEGLLEVRVTLHLQMTILAAERGPRPISSPSTRSSRRCARRPPTKGASARASSCRC